MGVCRLDDGSGISIIAGEQARLHLEQLGLTQAAAVLDSQLQHALRKELSYADFLVELPCVEATARRERYLKARLQLAHFPFQRVLE